MKPKARWLVVGALVAAVGAFATYRIATARSACLADGGSYALATLTCTAKPRPIILQRGILRG